MVDAENGPAEGGEGGAGQGAETGGLEAAVHGEGPAAVAARHIQSERLKNTLGWLALYFPPPSPPSPFAAENKLSGVVPAVSDP